MTSHPCPRVVVSVCVVQYVNIRVFFQVMIVIDKSSVLTFKTQDGATCARQTAADVNINYTTAVV